ncbi:hypothetical protein [uncultured Sunxiuqinia sp.]|uniref:hypothetical protein n=1 Tax=uncultured Sunxiuqinia sp. TaxID=1573825 RepID=UPI002AA8BA41|nr:hypothetical protein [uncultured Sunxiuqinia sp.]
MRYHHGIALRLGERVCNDQDGYATTGDLLSNLVIGMGKKRIDYVQKMDNYFTDLEIEYQFYHQLDGHKLKINGLLHQYKIVSSFAELEIDTEPGTRTIYIILTIEGAPVFNTGLQRMKETASSTEVLANVERVKNGITDFSSWG